MDWNATRSIHNASLNTSSYVGNDAVSLLAFLVFLCLIGLVGNLMVIVAISLDKKMRKSAMNIVLLNLAFADFSNLIVCLPDIAFGLFRQGWLLPDFLCPTIRFFEMAFIYCSVMMQLAVCGERFTAINYPLKVGIYCTQRVFVITTGVIWAVAFLCAMPQAFHIMLTRRRIKLCFLDPSLFSYIEEIQFVVFYLIPMLVTIGTYGQISYVLWSSSQHLHEGRQKTKESESDRTRKAVVKMLIACVSVYFACYTPINLLFLSSKISPTRLIVPKPVRLLVNVLAYACSCANPFVYSIFSRKFRLRFRELLTCRKPSSMPTEQSVMFGSNTNFRSQRRLTGLPTQHERLTYSAVRHEMEPKKISPTQRYLTADSANRTPPVNSPIESQVVAELKCRAED